MGVFLVILLFLCVVSWLYFILFLKGFLVIFILIIIVYGFEIDVDGWMG